MPLIAMGLSPAMPPSRGEIIFTTKPNALYSSTLETDLGHFGVPPIAYICPFITPVDSHALGVGMSDFLSHVSDIGLYTSTVERLMTILGPLGTPPIAYILPLTTLVAKWPLAVGISDFLIQVSVAGSYLSTIENAVPPE